MTRPDHDPELTEDEGDEDDRSLAPVFLQLVEADGEALDLESERITSALRKRLFGIDEPMRVGRFRVTRHLGSGGMGDVYLADDEHLNREVAIKLVRGSQHRREQDRLRSEAQSMARLAHPNVVTVFEVGEHRGRTYVVMEYVSGHTLAQWLKQEPRSWRRVLGYFVAAGRGLAAAHHKGLVHRDFKPDNVLLGHGGAVKVSDFGLALAGSISREDGWTDELDPSHVGSSVAGSVVGTTRYMSLEQLCGRAVDARSDQFSFCLALYEGLWGEPPFVDGDVVQRHAALERGIAKPPPLGRTHGLWPVVRRGLARAPGDRWPSMDALLDALEGVSRRRLRLGQASVTVTAAFGLSIALLTQSTSHDACEDVAHEIAGVWDDARRSEFESRVEKFALDHATESARRVSTGLDLWAASWIEQRGQSCRALADEPSGQQLARDACLTDQRREVEDLVDALVEAEPAMLADAVVLVAELPDPATCVDESSHTPVLAPIPAELAWLVRPVRDEIAEVTRLRRLGRVEPALALAERVDVAARGIDYGPLQAEARAALAMAEDVAGNPAHAAELYETAIDLAEIHHHDRLAVELWIERAELSLVRLDEPRDEAAAWLQRAEVAERRLAQAQGGSNPEHRARLAFGRGRLAELDHDAAAAEAAYRAAVEFVREVGSADLPSYLGHLAARLEGSEALALRREACEFARDRWGSHHPRVAQPCFNLGVALLEVDADEGEAELEAAVAIWTQAHQRAHPDLARAHVVLARGALQRGDLGRAEQHARTLAAIQAEVLSESDPERGVPEEILAKVEGVRGHAHESLVHARAALRWFEKAEGEREDSGAAEMRGEIVNQLLALKRFDEAEAELASALARAGEDPRRVAEVRLLLAELALCRGTVEQAALELDRVDALNVELGPSTLIAALLRAIVVLRRGGALDRDSLNRIHAMRERSPFSPIQLDAWLLRLDLTPNERAALEDHTDERNQDDSNH